MRLGETLRAHPPPEHSDPPTHPTELTQQARPASRTRRKKNSSFPSLRQILQKIRKRFFICPGEGATDYASRPADKGFPSLSRAVAVERAAAAAPGAPPTPRGRPAARPGGPLLHLLRRGRGLPPALAPKHGSTDQAAGMLPPTDGCTRASDMQEPSAAAQPTSPEPPDPNHAHASTPLHRYRTSYIVRTDGWDQHPVPFSGRLVCAAFFCLFILANEDGLYGTVGKPDCAFGAHGHVSFGRTRCPGALRVLVWPCMCPREEGAHVMARQFPAGWLAGWLAD
ncbi:hypothetical protein Purlil1_2888 [Purpureocillium lilacinum]|uniref:Uncharacterized protein n=1 Tax=Purpureocillium lilacinum TaxID=33203 RepID=A0ABR0CAK5_PURLI|nr:hypothetical protein Purlil1_2888 [Purpureocillium lilacinum]